MFILIIIILFNIFNQDDTLDEEDEERLNLKMMGMNDNFDDDLCK